MPGISPISFYSTNICANYLHVVESMAMETEPRKLPPPPGLIASLVRGFNSVANHVLVILPPVLLDLFLWLGPHLRLKSFFQPFIDQLPSMAKAFPSNFPDLAAVQQAWPASPTSSTCSFSCAHSRWGSQAC